MSFCPVASNLYPRVEVESSSCSTDCGLSNGLQPKTSMARQMLKSMREMMVIRHKLIKEQVFNMFLLFMFQMPVLNVGIQTQKCNNSCLQGGLVSKFLGPYENNDNDNNNSYHFYSTY